MSRQLTFLLAALPIVIVAGALALARRNTTGEPAGPPSPSANAAPLRDRPDVAVPPGRPQPPDTDPGAPAPAGNADLSRPPRGQSGARGRVTRREVDRAAAVFARDWLDYLAGDRPASAVRAAEPKLLLGFAGGDPAGIGPGREGLRGLSCQPVDRNRHACVAAIAGGAPFRFVMSTNTPGARVQTVALELD